MKILITGSAGFIGSNLVERLLTTESSVEIVGLDSVNDYYDVRLKEYRLNRLVEIAEKSVANKYSFVKGNLADKALIEALAVGVPSVSTDCTPGGPDFLTNHGKRGLLVPVNDPESMANEICRIIESDNLSNELSCAGQEIISILDKNVIAEKWRFFSKVYKLLINDYKSRKNSIL